MNPSRRTFLRTAGAAGLGLGLGVPSPLTGGPGPTPNAAPPRAPEPPRRALRLLVLGGTSFIGPHQVRYALDRGHEVTLFNRGRTNPGLFPGVETLIGDRNGDLESLKGRRWDVCIDNSASNFRWLELSTEALRDSVDRYFYVSSRSAYADTSRVPMTADHPTFTYETAGVERGAESLPYGLQKALSERVAQRVFGERACIFRPGLIIGPGDATDRFTYWPVRIHRGGEILAPSDGSDPIQIIDVRDLTEWMIRMAEDGHTGVYNAVGPFNPRRIDELLYGIRAVTTAETTFTWVDTDFLIERDVRPYREMPVWMPPLPGREGFARFDLTPEVERGLTFRPLAVTTADTLEYHFSRPAEAQSPLRAGLSAEREAAVLAEWHRSRAGRGR
ncbi:MAG: NAD-dependent epimerase/dehydratase family protein [Longimicrobiales bacterium]|nr:NAD-dependent epimerase/dehydratase family protein [Longimicrobiales bacterium]